MILIKYDQGLFQEALNLIQLWREVEEKIRSTNTEISIQWNIYEKKILDIQKKELENYNANKKSFIRKLP